MNQNETPSEYATAMPSRFEYRDFTGTIRRRTDGTVNAQLENVPTGPTWLPDEDAAEDYLFGLVDALVENADEELFADL